MSLEYYIVKFTNVVFSVMFIVYCLQPVMLPRQWYNMFVAVGFINVCVNPLIYAARYDTFKQSIKRMLSVELTSTAVTQRTAAA